MNWKSWLAVVLLNLVGISVIFILDFGIKGTTHLGPPAFIIGVIGVVASSLGMAGQRDLARSGHRKVGRILGVCLIILIFGLPMLLIAKGQGAFEVLSCAVLALAVAPFPLALCLIRNQNKSTSQPTSANAS